MSSSLYKLTYFEHKGRVEAIRFLFKYANIEFEDARINRQKDWPNIKPSTFFGQLPLLEYDGKVVNQSIAICRYVGKLTNLGGNNDWEDLEIDAVVDTISDLRHKIFAIRFEEDEEKRKKVKVIVVEETVPYYLSKLDAMVQKNKSYLTLSRLTWADFYFAATAPGFEKMLQCNILADYKNLVFLIQRVNELPAIKKWIEERPKTEF